MAIAAVPAYLGKDFSQASPGLRFGMYLPLWGVDSRSRETLWTTYDLNYRATGQRQEERQFKDPNKTAAFASTTRLNPGDRALMAALGQRQAALAAIPAAQGRLLLLHAEAVAPFTTGLGNEHPLENGFAFLNPYGLPYLPGSGVKGALRAAARELSGGEWGDRGGWSDEAITALFGKTGADGENDLQRGALMFWDVIPQIQGDALQVEVMTPHQTHYYQNGDSPHESGQPNPINFLTVPPRSKFVFHVQCDLRFLARRAPELLHEDRWQQLMTAAAAHAFQWLGFGAKTAVGYGAMKEDQAARSQYRRKLQAIHEREQAALAARRRTEELAGMAPTERLIGEFLDQRPDKNVGELAALIGALKRGQWAGDERTAVAQRVKTLMEQAKKWKEKSEKKNPLKDHDHQDTLLVHKWLAGEGGEPRR